MKPKFLCCAVIAILLAGCSSYHKSIRTDNSQTMLISKAQLSNSFKSFWKDLIEEANGKSLEQYIPSQTLIERYSLREQNQHFLVSGFLHTDSTFNKTDVENLGGNVVTYSNKIKTFSVPIGKIPQFIQIKGIIYIEIGKKVKTI
ncbi:hypothetical protein [uncultured Bacteroides sp.]|uniref:hypothetical protein n=1 Tax=uncultured Bacteroides sp. TaxID=162156 RepID=UPI002AAB2ADA|nr:hypothetical protein [uncultured Bacteroides sp.]